MALIATIILAPIAAMLIQMAISRSREFAADATGAQIAGNPYGLADALRKIDAVSKRVPLDANPATAHMFIIKPFQWRRPDGTVQQPSSDRGSHSRASRRNALGKARPLLVNGGRDRAPSVTVALLPQPRFSFPFNS